MTSTTTGPGETTAVIALRPVGTKYRGRHRRTRTVPVALGVLLAAAGIVR